MRRWTVAVAAPVALLGAGVVTLGQSRAADHLDSPGATNDPAADIADVYAFTSPENAKNLVLIMNVAPFGGAARFSDKVDYAFRIRKVTSTAPLTLGADVLDVTCTFDDAATQSATCAAPNGVRASAVSGDATGGGTAGSDLRIFAGARSDPFFFDLPGFNDTVQSGRPRFTGTNTFDKTNVLSLVVEVNVAKAFGGDGVASAPILSVAAATVRRPP